jgi:Fe-S cluster biogenesis protein NfuA
MRTAFFTETFLIASNLVYDTVLMMNKEEVQKVLDRVRPMLQADGGDVELVDVDEETGQVKVRLTGACGGCPMSQLTLKMGIESELKKQIPEVKEVVSV